MGCVLEYTYMYQSLLLLGLNFENKKQSLFHDGDDQELHKIHNMRNKEKSQTHNI